MDLRILTFLVLVAWPGTVVSGTSGGLCPEANSTPEITDCLGAEVEKAEGELSRYLEEARGLLADREEARKLLIASQDSWTEQRDLFCGAISESYSPGTMAGPALLGWKLELTKQRTHQIWDAFIRTSSSSLQEPGVE